MVPASGILRMLALFSRIWWTTSLLCSVTADFPGWYSWMQQPRSLILVALEWLIVSMRVRKGTHSTLQPWWCKQPCSPEMSASTHVTTQCHNSEERLIYLQYLNTHVPEFSFTHYVCNSGYLPLYLQQNSATQFRSPKVNTLILVKTTFSLPFLHESCSKIKSMCGISTLPWSESSEHENGCAALIAWFWRKGAILSEVCWVYMTFWFPCLQISLFNLKDWKTYHNYFNCSTSKGQHSLYTWPIQNFMEYTELQSSASDVLYICIWIK
jgi:hypothetical protein